MEFMSAIITYPRAENRVIVTLDADFHAIIAVSGLSSPSVIRIRIEGLHADALVTILIDVVGRYQAELEQGALVAARPHRIRLRRLPV